jgi:hypothetical protein
MSTIRTTNLQNPSAASPNMVLASDGKTTFGGAVVGAGMDLVAPTGISFSGGSATLSGGVITYAGITSLSINGIFSATYDNYRIMFSDYGTVAGTATRAMRMRATSTDTTTGYYQAGTYVNQSTGPTRAYNANVAQFTSGDVGDYNGGTTSSLDLFSPFLSSTRTSMTSLYQGVGTGSAFFGMYQGWLDNTASYNGITVFPTSGTLTGSIRVYGYKNS